MPRYGLAWSDAEVMTQLGSGLPAGVLGTTPYVRARNRLKAAKLEPPSVTH